MNRIISALLVIMLAVLPVFAEDMPEVNDVPLRSARLRAVGDLMMHHKQLEIAHVGDGEYDFTPQYALARAALSDADYTIGNLETTVGMYNDREYSGYPCFNAPESLLYAIKDAGIDFLTLANNHILDRYYDGMVTTVNNVEAFGFDHAGAYRSQEEADAPVIVEVNGIKIGMLAYTEHTNAMERFCDPEATIYGVDYLANADFDADVKALRDAGAEVVIAMPHWGTEYVRRPDAYVREYAREMIAAGVDIILGSHPHMVQPIEWVTVETEGGERTALVAWSLGNFIDNMKVRYTDSGIVLDFTLRERGDGTFEIVDVGYVPVYCWKQSDDIQTLCSGEYMNERPDGMDSSTYARMKESRTELIELIGEDFAVLDN